MLLPPEHVSIYSARCYGRVVTRKALVPRLDRMSLGVRKSSIDRDH